MGTPACDKRKKLRHGKKFSSLRRPIFWRSFKFSAFPAIQCRNQRFGLYSKFIGNSPISLTSTSWLRIRPAPLFPFHNQGMRAQTDTTYQIIFHSIAESSSFLTDFAFLCSDCNFCFSFRVAPALLTLKCEFQICMKQKKLIMLFHILIIIIYNIAQSSK